MILTRQKKSIKNAYAVAYKLGLASTKVTNYRLEVSREKRQKKEKIVERQKIEAMAIKRQKARRGNQFVQ